MRNDTVTPEAAMARLGRPLWLTRSGMVAERLTRAFWPFWSLCLVIAGLLFLGVQDFLLLEAVWALAVLSVLGLVATLIWGIRWMRWPSLAEALDRLDRSLPGRPISALADTQAIGAGDPGSEAVWQAHVARMADRVRAARAVQPDLRVSRRDPFALRYVALMVFVLALIFGSWWKAASVIGLAPVPGSIAATGPSWEGWIEPPAYTGKPSLYLNDLASGNLAVPQGSRLSLRFYGQLGAIDLTQDVTAPKVAAESAADPATVAGPTPVDARADTFEGVIARSGTLSVEGGEIERSWQIAIVPDNGPEVAFAEAPGGSPEGDLTVKFTAHDDYGVASGSATLMLDLASVDRRYGLVLDPEPREPVVIDLPMTISGDRSDFTEALVEAFPDHPWSGLPVEIFLTVQDASEQEGRSPISAMTMPGRRFFDPMAAAVAEQRRDILWNRENAGRAARVIRALTWRPEGFIKNEKGYLLLRIGLRRLEAARAAGMDDDLRDDVAEVLWRAALQFEEGDLSSALERLRRAQDRLSEAMKNGATDEEIASLMDDLREAMQDYMRELAEQNQRDPDRQQAENQQMQEMTGDQLQEMLDQLQQLMEQGRMAEAAQLLEQLRRMMENMQVTQGQQGQQSPGQQAMEGLGETLREQQGLSDEAFRQLQEQFNPGQQGGQGQPNDGRDGAEGQGQSPDGQGDPEGEGEGDGQPAPGQQGQGGSPDSLADRQQALRNELQRQQGQLPGAGTPEGEAAREALDRAGEAMNRAEDALRRDQTAEALDGQADAMEALREGLRNLGDAMAQRQQQPGQGQQDGMAQGSRSQDSRDPLGREAGGEGRMGSEENLLQGEDVYRRARELLDEIRRRSGDQTRPDVELDYLRRLLDRF